MTENFFPTNNLGKDGKVMKPRQLYKLKSKVKT